MRVNCDCETRLLTAATSVAIRVGATSALCRCHGEIGRRRVDVENCCQSRRCQQFPPDGRVNVIPHLCALIVPVTQPGIDTIARRVAVSFMSRVLLALVNAVQPRENAVNEDHEDRY